MKKLLEAIETLAPFLGAYPLWVKGVFTAWVLLGAVLLLSLVLARVSSKLTNPAPGSSPIPTSTAVPPSPPTPSLAPTPGSVPTASTASERASAPDSRASRLQLSITGVEIFGAQTEPSFIAVTLTANGIECKYPSLENVEWAEVGPGMSTQQFNLPATDGIYEVRVSAKMKRGEAVYDLVSQETVSVDPKTDLPFSYEFSLYKRSEAGWRVARVDTVVKFSIRKRP